MRNNYNDNELKCEIQKYLNDFYKKCSVELNHNDHKRLINKIIKIVNNENIQIDKNLNDNVI